VVQRQHASAVDQREQGVVLVGVIWEHQQHLAVPAKAAAAAAAAAATP
jgi:hypothetical protein